MPTEQGIKNIDDWLFQKYGNSQAINNYNGSDTNTAILETLAKEYGGFIDSYKASKWTIEKVKQEIDAGRPVIVAVTGEPLGQTYGGHFLVVKGYTATDIITNDPGKTAGNSLYYNNTNFSKAMESQKGAAVVVMPKLKILSQSVYCNDQDCSITTVMPGDKLTFIYNINNPMPDTIANIRLGAQIKTSDPQGTWIDDPSNDKTISAISGIHDYSRNFIIPQSIASGFYDTRGVILNHETGTWIDSKELTHVFEIKEKPKPESKLDLVFLIDTTGSMWDDIEQVKLSANEIIGALDSKGLDYRVAIANYKDYPNLPYGEPTDYTYKLNLPFATKDNKQDIINAINGLSASGGADWRESVYSALVNAMTDANKDSANLDNYGWRKGVFKAIIIMGDAPPHSPEPWEGGHTLNDAEYWSRNIDPVRVYSVVVGYDSDAYAAFSEISEKTGGKAYLSPTANDVAAAIIKAIEDIGNDYKVYVDITPIQNETSPGSSAAYSVNITNKGNIADVYNVSLETENIAGYYRGYPLKIKHSWIAFNDSRAELDPAMSEVRPLTINVPQNWAGMENVTYNFSITVKSKTDESVSNKSNAELKVKSNKKSMAEYSKLETIWLSELVESSSIDVEIKNSLLDKLTNATSRLDSAIDNINSGKIKTADNMLSASQNIMSAFANQVEAQYDKKISQPDAEMLKEKADQIMEDIEKAKCET